MSYIVTIYFYSFFILERLIGIYFIFDLIGGKLSHLFKRCDCCERKYSNLFKIILFFCCFLEWKLFDFKILNKIGKSLSDKEFIKNKKNF
jgi:hypothetical protein